MKWFLFFLPYEGMQLMLQLHFPCRCAVGFGDPVQHSLLKICFRLLFIHSFIQVLFFLLKVYVFYSANKVNILNIINILKINMQVFV